MKTVTEFSGFNLRSAFSQKQAIQVAKKLEYIKALAAAKEAPAATETPEQTLVESNVESSADPVVAEAQVTAEAAQETPPEPTTVSATDATPLVKTDAVEVKVESEKIVIRTKNFKNQPPAQKNQNKKGGKGPNPNARGPKDGVQLTDEQRKELNDQVLEEFKKVYGEANKLEGEKLDFVVNALDQIDPRRAPDLKRVVVYALTEGEKAPSNAKAIGTHYYLAEYLPPTNPPKHRGNERGRGDGRREGGRDGRRGGRGGRGGRDGEKRGGGRPGGRPGDRNNDRGGPGGRRPGGPGQGPRSLPIPRGPSRGIIPNAPKPVEVSAPQEESATENG